MDRASQPAPPPVRRSGIAVARVLGVPVRLHASWLILAALVTYIYGGAVQTRLDLSPTLAYAVGFGFVVCLLVSVLLHELGHALTARRCGVGVRGITLELLGGYTEMDRDAPTPRVELVVSLAGPAVSLALGGLAVGATLALPSGTLPHEFAFQVAVANTLVAVFNSLPGLPLDGGRALRAGVWAASGDRHLGSLVAGWTGLAVAAVTALGAVLLYTAGAFTLIGMVFLLLIAFTLWQGAGQAIRVGRVSRRFPLVDLARLTRPLYTVPAGTPLAEAQRRADEAGLDRAALGIADASGRLVALVHPGAAGAVPPERRPWVAVDTVARSMDGVRTLPAGLRGEDVVRAVQADPGAHYLVTSGEDVLGVLHVADLVRLLDTRSTGR